MVYDLRKTSKVLYSLDGHKSTVNSISQQSLVKPKIAPSVSQTPLSKESSEMSLREKAESIQTKFKTIEEIREDARRNVQEKKRKLEEAKQQ